jgi:hypothetical protein
MILTGWGRMMRLRYRRVVLNIDANRLCRKWVRTKFKLVVWSTIWSKFMLVIYHPELGLEAMQRLQLEGFPSPSISESLI